MIYGQIEADKPGLVWRVFLSAEEEGKDVIGDGFVFRVKTRVDKDLWINRDMLIL